MTVFIPGIVIGSLLTVPFFVLFFFMSNRYLKEYVKWFDNSGFWDDCHANNSTTKK